MKRWLKIGAMLAALSPLSALAQAPTPPWEVTAPVARPLPTSLDLGVAPDADFLSQINAHPTLSDAPPISSKAEAVLNATVRGTANELPPTVSAGSLPTPPGGSILPPAGATTPYVYGGTTFGAAVNLGECNECVNRCNPCNNGIPGDPRDNRGIFGGTGPVRNWLRLFCPDVYHAGVWSVYFGANRWRSPILGNSLREAQMWPLVGRIGRMMNEPGEARIGKGVWEVLGESNTYLIDRGLGTIIIGGSGLLRYHRVRNHRIVPYFQAGFGGSYTDAADPTVVLSPTSTNFNFITQLGMGSNIFLNKKWAITTESSYTWIGNWGIGQGPGYHVMGGLIGVTRFFR